METIEKSYSERWTYTVEDVLRILNIGRISAISSLRKDISRSCGLATQFGSIRNPLMHGWIVWNCNMVFSISVSVCDLS